MDRLQPAAWWRFAENGGTSTADSSGNGHTLNWNGGAVLSPSSGPEGLGGAVTLDGSNDYATVTNEGPLVLRQDMTVEMLFRPHTATGSGHQEILSCRGTGTDASLFEIVYFPDDDQCLLFPASGPGSGYSAK